MILDLENNWKFILEVHRRNNYPIEMSSTKSSSMKITPVVDPILKNILTGLKDKSDDIRLKAAISLGTYVPFS